MKRFNEREKQIIQAIVASESYVTGKALSISLHISLRTIQYEIAAINKKITLIHSSNRGYFLNKSAYNSLKQDILLPSSTNEHSILRKLIFSDKPYQIDELADSFFMSTSSLDQKLKGFIPILQQYHLTIKRENTNIQISGNELNKRRFIKYLIFEEIDPAFSSTDFLTNYFQDIDLNKIKSIINNSINKYKYYIDNTYYNNIIINTVIALYRMRSDYYVSDEPETGKKYDSDEYLIAHEICEEYGLHCKIAPSAKDILYISSLLEGQIKRIDYQETVTPKYDIITNDFINEIDQILMDVFNYYMLTINYSEYLYKFALHVDGMLKRAYNAQPLNNELLNNIKKTCPFIHDVAVSIAQKISNRFHVDVVDSEIGYISIHIGYLIETATKNTDKIKVLLFCNNYQHIMETIEKKLLDNFSEIINLQLYEGKKDISIINIPSDLIITTKPVNIIGGKKVITISPFYTMMDHLKVDNAIHSVIEEKENSYRKKMLSSFFHENLFFKSDVFSKKEDVIQFLGQKTIDFGLTQNDFIESVLQRERLSSTCFFDTFAIPHAIDMNAKKTMFCVLISKKGIQWDEHKIHIILMIAVQQHDRKKFMELYNGIVQILANPEKIKKLVEANTHIEFINLLIDMDIALNTNL